MMLFVVPSAFGMWSFLTFNIQEMYKLVLFGGCEGEAIVSSWKLAKDASGVSGLTSH